MKLEWLEDIIAIFESESLNEAATRRYLTQPAFSRRVRSIEEYLGVELMDRPVLGAPICHHARAQPQARPTDRDAGGTGRPPAPPLDRPQGTGD